MDVRGHLGPLFGPGSGLALGEEVAHQPQPPRPENDDDGGQEQDGASNGPQRGGRRMPGLDEEDDAGDPEGDAEGHPDNEHPAPAGVRVAAEEGDHIPLEELPLGLGCVAPDDDEDAHRQEGGPSDEADVADMERTDDDLDDDEQRDQGDEEPDATPVGEGPRQDVGALTLEGNDQPQHGVKQHPDAAQHREQDEADTQPRDVDAGAGREGAADAADDPVVGASAQRAPPPVMVVQPMVAVGPPGRA